MTSEEDPIQCVPRFARSSLLPTNSWYVESREKYVPIHGKLEITRLVERMQCKITFMDIKECPQGKLNAHKSMRAIFVCW